MYIQKINYVYIKDYLPSQCVYVVCVRLYVCMHVCIYKSPPLGSSILYEYNSSDPKQNKFIILIQHTCKRGWK